MNPRVKNATAMDNYILKIEFTNGEIGKFDIKPYLEDKYWSRLRNIDIFRNVKVSGGSITWMNEEIDFCPDEVYENSSIQ